MRDLSGTHKLEFGFIFLTVNLIWVDFDTLIYLYLRPVVKKVSEIR